MGNLAMKLGAGSEDLGFSKQTLEEEDIAYVQLSGMYHWSKPFTYAYLNVFFIGMPSMIGLIIGSWLNGDTGIAFESSHLCLIMLNMCIQSSVHLSNHKTVDQLYRAIDNGFFSYGYCMDPETGKEIEKLRSEKKKRKKMYGDIFKILVVGALSSVLLKPVILYAILGKGEREVDGAGGLIYYSPSRNWIPFAEHWGPYLFGMALSISIALCTALTATSSVAIFVRFSEEFCHQLDVVSLGLNNVTRRAKFLYETKYGLVYSKSDSEELKIKFNKCLKDCLDTTIEHHIVIIDLFAGFKRMMVIPLFTVIFDGGALLFLATALCLSNESDSLKMIMPIFMTAELFYTYVYCGYGELLTVKFQEIGNSLYLDEWIDHTAILKPYFSIITAYTFIPKRLSAGFTSPNNESFGSVLRTAYSFLNLLLNRGRAKAV